jgi:DtxR family Mn-dependent transcriptional regulator
MDDHDLIDTSEMYLKAVLELEEEGIPTLRARLVERFTQSGPTVSQTVDRLRRNDLLELGADRQLVLTATGRSTANSIMRKHRLSEVFLHDIVGLEWPLLHVEACRWEHVLSDHAADLIDARLGHPRYSPYGNPIIPEEQNKVVNLVQQAGQADLKPAWIAWIGEPLQADPSALADLLARGLVPGTAIGAVTQAGPSILLGAGGTGLARDVARHIFVTESQPAVTASTPNPRLLPA